MLDNGCCCSCALHAADTCVVTGRRCLGREQVLQFTRIFGVGPIAAQNFYDGRNTRENQQIRTLDELKDPSNPGKLNDGQLWWLERLENFRHKIPRREVKEIEKTVEARCQRLFGTGVIVIACGSYRLAAIFSIVETNQLLID